MKGDEPFETKAREALGLGKSYLRVDVGFVTRIDVETDHWETIVSTDGENGSLPAGTSRDLGGTYCRHTIERDSPLALHDTVDQGYVPESDDAAYRCYHGTTLTVGGEAFGTVCFVATEPREKPFSDAETMFAELVARLLEHELDHERQQEELDRKTSLVNVLDRVLRHNIRNKMTVVRANAQLHAEKDEECEECEKITEAADDLIDMSETARHLGKVLNSRFEYQPVDVVGIARDVAAEISERYSDVTVEVRGPDRLVVSVLPSLETALWELAENAAEHAGSHPSVTIAIQHVDDGVEIAVADDGPGLPETEQDVLKRGIETPLVHGSGLGLWSVYWVVANHDGSISIDVDEGTTVTMTVPETIAKNTAGRMQIRRAGDRFHVAFEQAPTGMLMLDDEGSLVDLNERAATVLDRPVDALLGHHLSNVVTEVTGAVSITADGQVTATSGTGSLLFETKTGERRRVGFTLREDIVPGIHLLGFEAVE